MTAGIRRFRVADVQIAVADLAAVASWPRQRADTQAAAGLRGLRRQQYFAGRALLRSVLRESIDPEVAHGVVAVRTSGQPYLPARPETAVSVSHSGALVAVAVTSGRRDVETLVGIDIQVPQPVSAAMVGRCCSVPDAAELAVAGVARRAEEFAWIWTVQEACVKAHGAGLSARPWTVPVAVGQSNGRWKGFEWISLRAQSTTPLSLSYRRRLR